MQSLPERREVLSRVLHRSYPTVSAGIQIDRLSASSDEVLTSMSGILFEVSKHKYPGARIFLE